MNVSAWSVRHPWPVALLFFVLVLAGLVSFRALKVQYLPDLDVPTVSVTLNLPGAAAGTLEADVVRKVENALANQRGVRHVQATIRNDTALVTLAFNLGTDLREATDDVRTQLARLRAELPADLREPVVTKVDLAGSPILAYAVHTDSMDDEALSWFVDDVLTRRLMAVPGVGSVRRVGGYEREVHVALDPLRLLALGASVADISRQLRQNSQDSAGGALTQGAGERQLRTSVNPQSAQAFEQMELSLPNGRRFRLDQVATVRDTVADRRSMAMLDGREVVGFEVTRSRGFGEVEVGRGVQQALDALLAEHPGLRVQAAFNFVAPVRDEYASSMAMLVEGMLLAVVVVALFLRDLRATVITALSLPLSILPAFWGMEWLGFSLNTVTLLSLSLIIGFLVDDSIVEIENIVRHLRMGKSALRATLDATDEIGLAVIATTATLIAVFLPTAFMHGIPGQFFKQFGWTAVFAVFASLAVARMVTPLLAAFWLRGAPAHAATDGRLMQVYLRQARWCLQHPRITVTGSLVFLLASLLLARQLPTGFMPLNDLSQTQVEIELPPGATLRQTRDAAEHARLLLGRTAYIGQVFTTIGAGMAGAGPLGPAPTEEMRRATLTLQLAERSARHASKQEIEHEIRRVLQALPGAKVRVGLGDPGQRHMLVLTGQDTQALAAAAQRVEQALYTLPGLGNVSSSAGLLRPEIVVVPDLTAAANHGTTAALIGETLRIATVGDYHAALPKMNLPGRQIPVLVRLDPAAAQDLRVLERLAVPANRFGSPPVMLNQVASLKLSSAPAMLQRYDRQPSISIEVELSGMPLGSAKAAIDNLPAVRQLPPGVTLMDTGDAELMADLFSGFGFAMATGLGCMFIVLAWLFRDLAQPWTILAALPLSLVGAFAGLLMVRASLDTPALIGLLMLMGIATKNSILLVEYVIVARRDYGLSRTDALLDACRKRAQPIIMTTIAMGAGMLPVALGSGSADPSFRQPMAITVIGGLLTSTFLSLVVIPVVYALVDDARLALRRRLGAATGSRPQPHPDPHAQNAAG